MIKPFDYKIRKDGVKLIRRLDVKVNEEGETLFEEKIIINEKGKEVVIKEPIPTGFKIHKIGTNEYYDEAIDIENAMFQYEETTTPMNKKEDLSE